MKTVEVKCEGRFCFVPPNGRDRSFVLAPMLEGRKTWANNGVFKFENTGYNRDRATSLGLSVLYTPPAPQSGDPTALWDVSHPTPSRPTFRPPTAFYSPSEGKDVEIVEYDHQREAHAKFRNLRIGDVWVGALFGEMGTGKTKSAIDLANEFFCAGILDAVLVIAKKGVHTQWVEDEEKGGPTPDPSPVRAFTQSNINWDAQYWEGKPIDPALLKKDNRLKWFTFNFDGLIYKKPMEQLRKFLEAHKGRIGIIGDETHKIKNPQSKRNKAAVEIADEYAVWRFAMTGTPIAANLVDEYAQLKFVHPAILGHKYVSTFRGEFCVMGGWENRSVVGAQNLDRFKELTEPYTFRVLKEDCLDLPPKSYRSFPFSLSKEQTAAIQQLRKTQTLVLPTGEEIMFEGAAPTMGKIQEISNGFLKYVDSDGIDQMLTYPNPRIEALVDALDGHYGKVVIWCKFRQDVAYLKKQFGKSAVAYYGGANRKERQQAKEKFLDRNSGVEYFIATSAAAEGLDGLQSVCSLAIYYSNTFNSIDRWQSEDRIHRLGMKGTATIVDLIAKGCIDYNLVRNLKAKKSFAELVLDVGRDFGIDTTKIGKEESDDKDEYDMVEEREKARVVSSASDSPIDWELYK